MKYQIRSIEEKDYSHLISLIQAFAEFEKMPEKMTNSVEQMKSENEFLEGFVAVTDSQEVVGYVTFFDAYYTWVGRSLYMDDLYVKPEHRGQGIGSRLLKKVIEYAKFKKCNRLRWQVSGWNTPAMVFYKNLGADIDAVESNCDLTLN
jgi:predicted N-acetyltransferase YhbS